MNSLLASGAWSLDVLFFVLLLLGVFLGVSKGFVGGVCKLAGTIFAIFVAVSFCVSFQGTLEKSFGWSTALNNAIAPPFGTWIMIAICFLFLFGIVKLGSWLIGLVGTAITNSSPVFRIINMVLGGILGAFKAFAIIFLVLCIFNWIPSDALHNWMSSSGVVGTIFSKWVTTHTSIFR